MAISAGTQNEWSASGAASASTPSRDTEDGLLPVIKFLQNALMMKARGDGLHYQTLVLQLISRDDPSTLWRLYLGMCHCVTIISQEPDEFKELIDAVFRFDWRGNDKVVGAFSTFVSHLVSANSTYMLPAMHMLIRSLLLSPNDLNEEGNVDPQALARQRKVHETLQATLSLVPSGRSKLVNLLTRNYPHRRLRAEILSDFTLQALRVVQYAPLIEEGVVRLILERTLEIDVEIKITDAGDAVVDDDDGDTLFAMDGVHDGTADKKRPEMDEADEMAEKLDGIMLVLFRFLDQRLTAEAIPGSSESDVVWSAVGQDELESGSRRRGGDRRSRRSSTGEEGIETEPVAKLLQSLLLVFEERILPTHRSKFVQFVVFFVCGRAPGLGHALSTKLLDILSDESKPKLARQSSVAYLASFLARGLFLEASLVSKTVGLLLRWATDYIDRHGDAVAMPAPGDTPGGKVLETPVGNRVRSCALSWNGATPEPLYGANANGDRSVLGPMSALVGKGRGHDHTLFYSICQATFYVMCFRGNELIATDGIADQAEMWQRLLTCSLQPLRHCLDTVRREFSRLCVGLLEEYLPDELVESLESIAEECPIQHQPISVGASLSFTSPRSSSFKGKALTPSRVTKAGGLGQGWWDPLYSFFPFDPYLLRRSHVYVDSIYNTWKAMEFKKPDGRKSRQRSRKPSDDRSDIDSDNDVELDAMDASFQDKPNGLGSRARRIKRTGDGNRSVPGNLDGTHRETSWGSFITDGESAMSRLSVDTEAGFAGSYMSVTSGSSLAVGSLMSGGRSLGKAMGSSFAEDGLGWDGGMVGTSVDDAYFHENVSPSTSPPHVSVLANRASGAVENLEVH